MTQSVQALQVFDRAQLCDQLGGDEDLVREVIELFVEDCPAQLAAIRTAIEAGDNRQLYVVAHTLKGAAGTLAAHGVADAAQVLETLGREGRAQAAIDPCRTLEAETSRLLALLRDAGQTPRHHLRP
jgi:HPt (histidine-containing phosphotransfer) domain-containing protein